MRANIYKLYSINLLCGFVFWYPIEKLFLRHIGVSAFGISINAVVFLAVQLAFDVPSGVLADKWHRKYTLLLAMLALLGGSVIGGLSHSLPVYLLATVLVGGFVVLTSGTFQAIMYDSLRDRQAQQDYDKHQGRAYALFLTGLGISSLVGGYMAQWLGYRSTFAATAVIMGIAALLVLTLREPASHKLVTDRKLKAHVLFSVRHIISHQLLFQLALLVSAANILRGAQNEYAGLYFIALGLTAIPIGYATAIKWIISSVGQVLAPRLGRQALRLAPLFFIVFTLFSLIHSRWWSLACFFVAGFLYAIISNQAEAAVQDNIPGEIRATALSVLSFTSNALLVPLGLLFGWIAGKSVFHAYLMIAGIGLLYLLAWTVTGRRKLQPVYRQRAHAQGPPSLEEELQTTL